MYDSGFFLHWIKRGLQQLVTPSLTTHIFYTRLIELYLMEKPKHCKAAFLRFHSQSTSGLGTSHLGAAALEWNRTNLEVILPHLYELEKDEVEKKERKNYPIF